MKASQRRFIPVHGLRSLRSSSMVMAMIDFRRPEQASFDAAKTSCHGCSAQLLTQLINDSNSQLEEAIRTVQDSFCLRTYRIMVCSVLVAVPILNVVTLLVFGA